MRKRVLSIGLSVLGIAASGLSLAHCSFSLDARQVCADGGSGCTPSADLGTNRPDLAMDPDDPGKPGPYKVVRPQVTLGASAANAISNLVVFAPSTDGTTVDRSKAPYPFVLIAPARYLALSQLDMYAERLASHGFVVASWFARDAESHVNYRNAGLVLINELITSTDSTLMSLCDVRHIGLMGYELGAKISSAMAVQDTRVGALLLLDPVDVYTATGSVLGVQETNNVSLPPGSPIAIFGTPTTAAIMPSCYNMMQGYKNFYDGITKVGFKIEFTGAALGDFVANYPDPPCATGSTMDKSRTQMLTQKYITAYFQWLLKSRARSRDYVLGADFQADMQQGMLSLSQKGL